MKSGVLLGGLALGTTPHLDLPFQMTGLKPPIDSTLRRRLQEMPKTEIHVHLEGTMTPETAWQLAEKNHIRLPAASLEDWSRYYAFQDFSHFIDVYVAASGAIAKPEDFTHFVTQFAVQQQAQNVLYSEVFLSASLHLGRFADEAIIEALEKGPRSRSGNTM